jgi:hypothetical protein
MPFISTARGDVCPAFSRYSLILRPLQSREILP